MSKKEDNEQLRNILSESPKGIAELLKAAAHPIRIKVLALLLQGVHDFSKLMQHTKLSKTALANHMSQLIKKGLVQRVAKGEYNLTVDGKELLSAAATTYKNSAWRKEERRYALRRRYTKGLIEGKTLSRKVISKEVVYQHCWLSYTGAISGSLKALGVDCDTVDIGGYSGYAFLINVSKGITCPSGPTALPNETWKQIHNATENFGWTLEQYEYPHSYPEVEGKHTPKEIEIAGKLFEKIKQEIDEKDRPVVLWGLVVPEYGIVKGYEGKSYLTSTFRHLTNKPEDPILFYDLKAPGCLEALFFRDKAKPDLARLDRKALERVVRFAEAGVPILENYVAGPAALDEWVNVLENLPEEKQNYHGNSYVAACVQEGREMSGEFLKRLAKKHPGKHSEHLLAAAECYAKGAKFMGEFTRIFPFKFQGEMKLEDRRKGADMLRKVKPLEKKALMHMKRALEEWETP
ncbi:winged helix-turn-helix transcriptional regulator [Candidatus Bathyarchaeota archaeon]|nr:winged helix-turn-helix transcriptional regulator [Candidatus Bathyarchaeota archaeon]